ncbi:MAG: HlyD family efflux transporter periplasmic adaptor subunit, partial [Planctomycetia bacterium]|nr:HlyD family efflux transporter periplasmic adaptor subunit [Planctomycetia bacterium]
TRDVKLATARRLSEIAGQRLNETNNLAKTLTALQGRDKAELEQARFQSEAQKSQAQASLKEIEAADGLTHRQRLLEDDQLADGGPDDELLDHQVEAARAALDLTVVKAPTSGHVLAVMVRPGEVSAGPVLYLGDLTVMVAKAEVDQSDVSRVRLGDPAEVTVQGRPVVGKVTQVSRMIVPNQMRDIDPRALQDLRVIRVTILLDQSEEAARYVNMQVEATIRARQAVEK